MKIVTFLLILSSVNADDINKASWTNEDKDFWGRLLQFDGLSIPPNSPTVSAPILSSFTAPGATLPSIPVTPISMGKMSKGVTSKSKNSGMSPRNMISPPPTTFPQGRPNNGNPGLPPALGINNTLGINSTVTNTSSVPIPICKQDRFGSFLQYNDPQYDSPDTEIIYSELATFEETNASIATWTQFSNDVRDTLPTLAALSFSDASATFRRWSNAFASIALVAGFLSLGLNLLSPLIGGESIEDAILSSVTEGFRVVNEQLTDIQEQIKRGFTDLTAFVGNIALDELSADLDSVMRQYNAYVNATNETRIYYDASLRAYCNEPFRTPEDIFYNLYGYACRDCPFAPRKRANILEAIRMTTPSSSTTFNQVFGNFILLSMFNAMNLHAVCLSPIEGSCVDRSTDRAWQNGLTQMSAAFNESVEVITSTADSLTDWVSLFRVDEISGIVSNGIDNAVAAMNVMRLLNASQPEFYIQVLVGDSNENYGPNDIWWTPCQGGSYFDCPCTVQPCTTIRDRTGHIRFRTNDKHVSIRYRNKTLPAPPMEAMLDGGTRNFADFYTRITDGRLVPSDFLTSLGRSDGVPCDRIGATGTRNYYPACMFDNCFRCLNDAEQGAFNTILRFNEFFVHRNVLYNFREASNVNETFFPRATVTVGATFIGPSVDFPPWNRDFNTFTIYYI